MRRKNRKWKRMTDEQLTKYYHDYYDGIHAEQVNKNDSGFYKILGRRGLRHIISPRPIERMRGHVPQNDQIENGDMLLSYLRKYGDLNREVLEVEHPIIYNKMRKRGLLGFVPSNQKRAYRTWRLISDDAVMGYRRIKHGGKSYTQLSELDRNLANEIRSRGLPF